MVVRSQASLLHCLLFSTNYAPSALIAKCFLFAFMLSFAVPIFVFHSLFKRSSSNCSLRIIPVSSCLLSFVPCYRLLCLYTMSGIYFSLHAFCLLEALVLVIECKTRNDHGWSIALNFTPQGLSGTL